ncbi:MAG: alpha-amylase family glycosyl hydrolase [Cyanobacteria bacterium P01_C01_bin.72]
MVFASRAQLSNVNHTLAGLGATVVRDSTTKNIVGTFFKFWLPQVSEVFVLGSFNGFNFNFIKDKVISDDRKEELRRLGFPLTQLDNSGYWYGYTPNLKYSATTPKDNEYVFFVIGLDGKADFVADPIARDTVQREPDVNDAIALVVDWESFEWQYDSYYATERRDFRRYIIYQLHWGTFFRPEGDHDFEQFTLGATTAGDKRFAVAQRLKKISAMGFTAIELLPVHEANGATNAGYDPSFFFAIESAYGTPEDLRILVDEAHKIGLAVIFDVVVNHLTLIPKNSSFSQEFISGWYIKENAPWASENVVSKDFGEDPDFDRPQIRNIIFDSIQMYFSEYHIDGIRMDATRVIPRDALKEIIGKLLVENRRFGKFISAEHLVNDNNPFPYIIGDIGCSAGWDKRAFNSGMIDAIAPERRGRFDALRNAFETNYQGRPETAIKYVLGSHDEIWMVKDTSSAVAAINRVGGPLNGFSRMKMRLAWALNACAFGIPMMFMGTEYMTERRWYNYEGYNAKNKDAIGIPFVWEPNASSSEAQYMLMIKDINNLRTRYVAMRNPNQDSQLVHFDNVNGVYAYKRWDGLGNVLLITINISDGEWQGRDYQFSTNTPNSSWKEVFNSQYVNYGGWTGSGNSDPNFFPGADGNGLLQGINLPKWSLMILKQQ